MTRVDYDEILRELLTAVGAALFFANLWALLRRPRDADRVERHHRGPGPPG